MKRKANQSNRKNTAKHIDSEQAAKWTHMPINDPVLVARVLGSASLATAFLSQWHSNRDRKLAMQQSKQRQSQFESADMNPEVDPKLKLQARCLTESQASGRYGLIGCRDERLKSRVRRLGLRV